MPCPDAMRRTLLAATTLAVVGCGGVIAAESAGDAGVVVVVEAGSAVVQEAGTVATDAGQDATDAMLSQACEPPPKICYISVFARSCLDPQGGSPPPGVRAFDRKPDFLAFFQDLARLNDLVVPAHGVDCSPQGVDAGTCTYDPTMARLDASDVHYSDPASLAFVGPDGHPYDWLYAGDRNQWFFVDGTVAPSLYDYFVDCNEDDDGLFPQDASTD